MQIAQGNALGARAYEWLSAESAQCESATETVSTKARVQNKISRLQRSGTCPLPPGPMAQATASRAFGAIGLSFDTDSESLGENVIAMKSP